MSVELSEDFTTIELAETLDLRAAAALLDELKQHQESNIQLDAENVQRVGGQCAQVLLSAAQAWAEAQKQFHIINPSEAYQECMSTLGITQETFEKMETEACR